jgi:flagella synthesis protein FlgN
MRLSSDQQNSLAGLLAAELSESSKLLEILQRESDILGGNDPESIKAVSKEKLAQMQRLSQQLTQRDRFLTELGLPKGKEGTDRLLRSLPQESELADRWTKLQDLGEQMKKQNEINGNIVAVSQRQVRQALDVLSGKTGAPQTYGREGETRSTANQNTLAKA